MVLYIHIQDTNLVFETFVRQLTWCIEISCPMVKGDKKSEINTWFSKELANEREKMREMNLKRNISSEKS